MMLAAETGVEAAISSLYNQLIRGWNDHDAAAFAEPFADDAEVIGFDGSEQHGRDSIRDELARIFEDHETAAYVTKVRGVHLLGRGVAILRAVAGMIPPGRAELEPSRNAHQTVVAVEQGGSWRILLFQNTPARFDGRPELAEQLTEELREAGGIA